MQYIGITLIIVIYEITVYLVVKKSVVPVTRRYLELPPKNWTGV